jgi:hypothetical protein
MTLFDKCIFLWFIGGTKNDMEEKMTDQEYLNIQAEILKFAKDGDNRKKLETNPEKVLREDLNMAVPNDVEIRIINNEKNTYHFVLPLPDNIVNGVW